MELKKNNNNNLSSREAYFQYGGVVVEFFKLFRAIRLLVRALSHTSFEIHSQTIATGVSLSLEGHCHRGSRPVLARARARGIYLAETVAITSFP